MVQDETPHEVDALVRKAIEERRLIRFRLDGHERVAEPHDYGIMNGSVQLLVFQIGGSSRSGGLPNWRMVRLARASGFELLGDRFPGGRSQGAMRHKSWDQLFVRVKPLPS